MFKIVRLITFSADLGKDRHADLRARFDDLTAALPLVVHSRNRPALEGSVNGGDIVCHVQFANEADYRACKSTRQWGAFAEFSRSADVGSEQTVSYRQGTLGLGQPDIAGGVHRVLLLAVKAFIPEEQVAQFEAETSEMARYIPAIRNWGLSRVLEAAGTRRWTHVWEQEFAAAAGFLGPYMMHPYHFAFIDRWFDPQSHDWIVDTELCSTYCQFDQSAI